MKQSEETMQPIRIAMTKSRGPLFKFLTQGSIQNTTGSRALRPKLASTKKGIQNFLTDSILEIRPMSIDKLQGLRSKVNTIDEWLSGKVMEDPIGAIEQGASKLNDYFILATSSEGTVRDGVGDEIKIELARILRREIEAHHVSIWHYKLDKIEEVANEDMWVKAQPNIGMTVSYDAYQRDVERAESEPATRNDILAKRFGIPVEGYTYFFTYEETLPTVIFSRYRFKGMECYMGADMSQGDDFCAFNFLFELRDGRFGTKARSYVSQIKYDKLPEVLRRKYDEFVKEGTLRIMPGAILNMMDVYDDLDLFIQHHEYIVVGLGYDPYNADAFVNRWKLENSPFGVHKVIQGARTESVPLGEIKILAREGMLIFDEEIMKFAMGNSVVIEDTNGNRKLSKRRSEEKIDNVSALMDAKVAYNRDQEGYFHEHP
jgi:phage terminase large subunit-like protein